MAAAGADFDDVVGAADEDLLRAPVGHGFAERVGAADEASAAVGEEEEDDDEGVEGDGEAACDFVAQYVRLALAARRRLWEVSCLGPWARARREAYIVCLCVYVYVTN